MKRENVSGGSKGFSVSASLVWPVSSEKKTIHTKGKV